MSVSRPIADILADLRRLQETQLHDPDPVSELATEASSNRAGIKAVPLVLSLLERNSHLDWGSPGPVVHELESFFGRGYEEFLLESVSRTPTAHTLWMLNRVINGIPEEARGPFLDSLHRASKRTDIADEVRQAAEDFLEFHGVE